MTKTKLVLHLHWKNGLFLHELQAKHHEASSESSQNKSSPQKVLERFRYPLLGVGSKELPDRCFEVQLQDHLRLCLDLFLTT